MYKWRIYYADDSTFDNTKGRPEEAPSIGVICVKQFAEGKEWRIQAFRDYYIWSFVNLEWWAADASGFWQYMFEPGNKIVKFGTNIPDEPFERIMAFARNDDLGEGSIIT